MIFLWNELGPDKFAIITLIEIIPIFLTGLMTLSIDQYLMRHYYEWPEKDRGPNILRLWAGSLFFATAILVLMITTFFIFHDRIFYPDQWFNYATLALVNVYVTSAYNVPFSVIRISSRPSSFFVIKIISFSVYGVLIFALVFEARLSLFGYYLSLIFSNVVHLLATLFYMRGVIRNSNVKSSNLKTPSLLRYTLPLVPANVMGSLLGMVERIFLQRFVPLDVIGHYGLAGKFAELITQLHGVMKLSYGPSLFRVVSTYDSRKITEFSDNAKYYILPIILVAAILVVLKDFIFSLISLKNASLVSDLLTLTSLSAALNALQIYIAPGPIVTKRTTIKLALELALLAILITSAYLSLLYFGINVMLIYKSIILTVFLIFSYMVTKKLIPWKINRSFIFKNAAISAVILFCTYMNAPVIIPLSLLVVLLLVNIDLIRKYYAFNK